MIQLALGWIALLSAFFIILIFVLFLYFDHTGTHGEMPTKYLYKGICAFSEQAYGHLVCYAKNRAKPASAKATLHAVENLRCDVHAALPLFPDAKYAK